jgi:hypothetical protein
MADGRMADGRMADGHMADGRMPNGRDNPMAIAMQWVSRVFAASLMMVLPGLGGRWLDERWGTWFIGACGFVLGMVSGVVYLIGVTRAVDASRKARRPNPGDGDRSSPPRDEQPGA